MSRLLQRPKLDPRWPGHGVIEKLLDRMPMENNGIFGLDRWVQRSGFAEKCVAILC